MGEPRSRPHPATDYRLQPFRGLRHECQREGTREPNPASAASINRSTPVLRPFDPRSWYALPPNPPGPMISRGPGDSRNLPPNPPGGDISRSWRLTESRIPLHRDQDDDWFGLRFAARRRAARTARRIRDLGPRPRRPLSLPRDRRLRCSSTSRAGHETPCPRGPCFGHLIGGRWRLGHAAGRTSGFCRWPSWAAPPRS